jgi:hypothetical protein
LMPYYAETGCSCPIVAWLYGQFYCKSLMWLGLWLFMNHNYES